LWVSTKNIATDQIKKKEAGGTRGTYGGGGGGCINTFLVGKPEGKRQFARPRRRLRTVLEWIFKKWDWRLGWLDGSGTRKGQMVSYSERENTPLGSIKCGNIFTG